MKIVKFLEDSGLLIKLVTQTTKSETREQTAGIFGMLLGILGVILLGNMLVRKDVTATRGRGVI